MNSFWFCYLKVDLFLKKFLDLKRYKILVEQNELQIIFSISDLCQLLL